MASPFDPIDFFLTNFNRLYKITIDCLKFYLNPKKFLLEVTSKRTEQFVKKLIISFLFIESLLVLIGSVLVKRFEFGLGKVPGLVLVDALYSLPLILIIFLSLRLAKISSAFKKSLAFVLFTKVFFGLPTQLLYFLFVSTENYVYYISFWIVVQLLLVFYLFSAPLFYCDKIKQAIIVLSSSIPLFVALVLAIAALSSFGSSSGSSESTIKKLDPIFTENEELGKRSKVIEAIDLDSFLTRLEQFLRGDIVGDPAKTLEEFKEDAKYRISRFKEKAKSELDFFNDKNNIQFETNRGRYSIYVNLLYKVIDIADMYYEAGDYYKLRIRNIGLERDIAAINDQVPQYADLGDEKNQKKLILEEVRQKGLGQRLLVMERVNKLQELYVSLLKKQIEIQENTSKVWQFLINYQEAYGKIQEQRFNFEESQLKYLDFILRWSFII